MVDANAMLVALKHQLSLLEKQIRMLSQLAEAAPALHHEQELGDRHEKADFVVVHQQRMLEIVDQMKQQVRMIRISVGAVSEGNA